MPKILIGSQSRNYIKEFCKLESKIDSDLIEIHNRPNYLPLLKSKLPSKNYALYFHNDPLTMTGSKSISDRKFLLKNNKYLPNYVKNRKKAGWLSPEKIFLDKHLKEIQNSFFSKIQLVNDSIFNENVSS